MIMDSRSLETKNMSKINSVWVLFILLPKLVFSIDFLLKTKLGPIQGLLADDGDYVMFLGVPYAKVNETNPFGESLPHPPFNTIFEANDDGIMCPQQDEFNQTIQGTINCLTLNMYIPKSANYTNKLPVLVYVYGGNHLFGLNSKYDLGPKYLVRHDIIVVLINYRVGPYGFLCLDIPEVPGNQGFKDQKNALKWVYDNIEDFGGDQNKITIDGHSSGADSVNLILQSLTENEKLIDKVILQSGTSLNSPARLQTSHNQDVLKMVQYVGFNTTDVTHAIKILTSLNSSLVIDASLKLGVPYGHCDENPFGNNKNSVPKYGSKVPGAKNLSFMFGNTEKESLSFFALSAAEKFKRFDSFVSQHNIFNMKSKDNIFIAKIISDMKLQNKTLSTKNKVIQNVMDLYFFRVSKDNMFKYLKSGAKDVYYYIFSYKGQRNHLSRKMNLPINGGPTHADEISYLFDMSFMEQPSANDRLIIDRMTTLWANFVKYGDPTPVTTDLLPVKWIPYSKEKRNYLNIDTEMSLKSTVPNTAMALIDLFFSFITG